MNEIAYRLWLACRDKDVSTDAVTMIADALRAAEHCGFERGLEEAARAIENGIVGFTIHGFIKPDRAARIIRALAGNADR